MMTRRGAGLIALALTVFLADGRQAAAQGGATAAAA
jgi:hypothetical protein